MRANFVREPKCWKVNVREVKPDEKRTREDGFTDMLLSWLVNEHNAGSQNIAVGHTYKHPGGQHRLHLHKNVEEIIFILKGKGVQICGETEFEVKAGDCIFIPRGIPHSQKNTGDEPIETIFVYAGAPSFEKTGYVLLENEK